jgi:uncharacterized RDD family membrane protein YckC
MADPMKTYAGFWQRAGAFALDYIPIFVYLLAVTLLFLLLNTFFDVSQQLFANRVQAQLIVFLLVTLPVVLYFAAGESSNRLGTWGKQRLGLKVTSQTGNRISFWRAFARTLLKFIPWEISHTLIWQIRFSPRTEAALINYGFALVYLLIGLNIVILLVTKNHQTIYDLLVKTYVIKQAE